MAVCAKARIEQRLARDDIPGTLLADRKRGTGECSFDLESGHGASVPAPPVIAAERQQICR
jgi:hypothetical protein